MTAESVITERVSIRQLVGTDEPHFLSKGVTELYEVVLDGRAVDGLLIGSSPEGRWEWSATQRCESGSGRQRRLVVLEGLNFVKAGWRAVAQTELEARYGATTVVSGSENLWVMG